METKQVLICEFLDWYIEPNDGFIELPYEIKENYNDGITYCKPYDLKFNSDWNWLMLAIDKIEKMNVGVHICKDHCIIHKIATDDSNYFHRETNNNKMQAVFDSVIRFIEWNNLKLNK